MSNNGENEDLNWDPIWRAKTSVDGQGWTAKMQIPFSQLRYASGDDLVLRWEYFPGSTLYLVWSQGRSDYLATGDFSFGNDLGHLFDTHPYNVFLVKFSYNFQL